MSEINKNSIQKYIKGKYILTNTLKTNKSESKLSKNINNITLYKSFIGHSDFDFINNEIQTTPSALTNFNLYVNGNAKINAISLNNNLSLDTEIMDNIYIRDNTLSTTFYKAILNNIVLETSKINNLPLFISINFSLTQQNFISGIIPIYKKFILKNDSIITTALMYVALLNKNVITLKPLKDTVIMINSSGNIVNKTKNYASLFHIIKKCINFITSIIIYIKKKLFFIIKNKFLKNKKE